ncbi:MAG: hypothetical protein JO168_06165 [Solirubrobacterales bacterium]|nr:hypothetical protein [Solirubrobacterales bacterium]
MDAELVSEEAAPSVVDVFIALVAVSVPVEPVEPLSEVRFGVAVDFESEPVTMLAPAACAALVEDDLATVVCEAVAEELASWSVADVEEALPPWLLEPSTVAPWLVEVETAATPTAVEILLLAVEVDVEVLPLAVEVDATVAPLAVEISPWVLEPCVVALALALAVEVDVEVEPLAVEVDVEVVPLALELDVEISPLAVEVDVEVLPLAVEVDATAAPLAVEVSPWVLEPWVVAVAVGPLVVEVSPWGLEPWFVEVEVEVEVDVEVCTLALDLDVEVSPLPVAVSDEVWPVEVDERVTAFEGVTAVLLARGEVPVPAAPAAGGTAFPLLVAPWGATTSVRVEPVTVVSETRVLARAPATPTVGVAEAVLAGRAAAAASALSPVDACGCPGRAKAAAYRTVAARTENRSRADAFIANRPASNPTVSDVTHACQSLGLFASIYRVGGSPRP